MTGFEYGLGVIAVIIGLAVTDVAQSAHRLLRARDRVRWDPLALLVAFYVLLTVVRMWFTVWRIRDFELVVRYPFFVWLFLDLFVLFLLAAACLPDDPERDGLDLRAWYERQRRYFWTLFALFQASYLAHWWHVASLRAGRLVNPWPEVLWSLAPLLIFTGLIFTGRRWIHYAALAVVMGIQARWLWTMTL